MSDDNGSDDKMVENASQQPFWHAWRLLTITSIAGECPESVFIFDKKRLRSEKHISWVGNRVWILICSADNIELKVTNEIGYQKERQIGLNRHRNAVEGNIERPQHVEFCLDINANEEAELSLTNFVLSNNQGLFNDEDKASNPDEIGTKYLVLMHLAALFWRGPNWADADTLAKQFKMNTNEYRKIQGQNDKDHYGSEPKHWDCLGNVECVYGVAKSVCERWQKMKLLHGILLHQDMLTKGLWNWNRKDRNNNIGKQYFPDNEYFTIRSAFVNYLMQHNTIVDRRMLERFQLLMKEVPDSALALSGNFKLTGKYYLTDCAPNKNWTVAKCLRAIANDWAHGAMSTQQRPMITELSWFLSRSLFVSDAWRLANRPLNVHKENPSIGAQAHRFLHWSLPISSLVILLTILWPMTYIVNSFYPFKHTTVKWIVEYTSNMFLYGYSYFLSFLCLVIWLYDFCKCKQLQAILFVRVLIGSAAIWILLFTNDPIWQFPVGGIAWASLPIYFITSIILIIGASLLIRRESYMSGPFTEPGYRQTGQVIGYLLCLVSLVGYLIRFMVVLLRLEYNDSTISLHNILSDYIFDFDIVIFFTHVAGVLFATLVLYAIFEDNKIIEDG